MQLLSDEHDLRQRQRVDQGESMQHEANVLFGENHGLINNKEREHNKEVERHHQVAFCFRVCLVSLTLPPLSSAFPGRLPG
jgi:hypothetical protein